MLCKKIAMLMKTKGSRAGTRTLFMKSFMESEEFHFYKGSIAQ